MPDELDLVAVKDMIDKFQNDDSNAIGKLNLAACLGERAHFLVAEIEKLYQGRSDLLAERDALREMLMIALPMLEEYKKWLVDDAIARYDLLTGPAWDELENQINQARAALDVSDERNENEQGRMDYRKDLAQCQGRR